jgi:hypothetical protein
MKATFENLVNVFNLRFGAKYKVSVYADEGQLSVWDVSVPTLTDARGIVSAFYKNAGEIVNSNSSFGFVEVYACDGIPRRSVDMETLSYFVSREVIKELRGK